MIGRMRRTKARSPDGRTGTRRVPASCLLAVLSLLLLAPGGIRLAHRLSGEAEQNLMIHRDRLHSRGAGYLFGPEWLSRNTDGPGNPLSRVFSRKTARALLHDFVGVRFAVACLNRRHVPLLGRYLSPRLERRVAARWGWHLHVFATKPGTG